MIVFENIKWKNFLSTGDQWTEIELIENPSTLIVGANGAGKSTLLDALCFALFNKPFRKISRGQLVNSINEKGLKVELSFSIGRDDYRVFRGAKPNIFELYKNNKMVDQDAAAKDTQKYLEQSVLKLNFKSFTQVVILGSSTFVPFMQLTAPNRREVIEDLLDITIFSHMNSLLKDRVRTALAENNECEHALRLAEEKVQSQEKLINSLSSVNKIRQEEKTVKIRSNQDQIDQCIAEKEDNDAELKLLEKDVISTVDKEELVRTLRQEQADVNSELKIASKNLKFFKSHDQCPTCTQSIKKTFKEKKINELTKDGTDISNTLQEITVQIADAVEVIDEANKLDEKCSKVRSKVHQQEREIVRLEMENLELNKELIDLQTNTPNMSKEKKTLKELVESFKVTQSECGEVTKTLDEYKVISQLLRDSGIKSQIIKKYVPIFNNLINKYLHNMDFFVNFTLDEEFKEIIKSRFRDEFS